MFVKLNKGEGTVTMDYGTYRKLFHDSLLLHILLRQKIVPESAITDLLYSYIDYEELGSGFMDAQSPLPDDDAFAFVYGKERDKEEN